jgi:hypothetical protein
MINLTWFEPNKRHQIKQILLTFAYHQKSSMIEQIRLANMDLSTINDRDIDCILNSLKFMEAEFYSVCRTRHPRIKMNNNLKTQLI